MADDGGGEVAERDGTVLDVAAVAVGRAEDLAVAKDAGGELLVDVTADGFYIEADRPVEVIEVQGSRVIVKAIA